MSTITITDPKDYQEGDYFVGRRDRSIDYSTLEVQIRGPLTKGRASHKRLYVENFPTQPYVDVDAWYDVTVTREVPDPPTSQEQFDVIPVGKHFTVTERDGHSWPGSRLKTGEKTYVHYYPQNSYSRPTVEAANFAGDGWTIAEVTE